MLGLIAQLGKGEVGWFSKLLLFGEQSWTDRIWPFRADEIRSFVETVWADYET